MDNLKIKLLQCIECRGITSRFFQECDSDYSDIECEHCGTKGKFVRYWGWDLTSKTNEEPIKINYMGRMLKDTKEESKKNNLGYWVDFLGK